MEHALIVIVVLAAFGALIWQAYIHRSTLHSVASPAGAAAAPPSPAPVPDLAPPSPAPAAAPLPSAVAAPAWAPTKTKAEVLATIPEGAQLAEEDMRSMAASALLFAQKGNADVPPNSALREFNAPTTANPAAIATYRAYWGI